MQRREAIIDSKECYQCLRIQWIVMPIYHLRKFNDNSLATQNLIFLFFLLLRAQHLSNLGCLSSYSTLQDIRERMMYDNIMLQFSEKYLKKWIIFFKKRRDETGRTILAEKPRVNHGSANIPELLSLPKDAFGYDIQETKRNYCSMQREYSQSYFLLLILIMFGKKILLFFAHNTPQISLWKIHGRQRFFKRRKTSSKIYAWLWARICLLTLQRGDFFQIKLLNFSKVSERTLITYG